MNTSVFDVVVIGGGIVGATIAFSLSKRDVKVAVVEKAEVGSGTSQNSFAWINATAKTSDRTYFNLNASGVESYHKLATEWGEHRIGLHRTGMLEWVDSSDESKLQALRNRASRLEEFRYPVSWVHDNDLCAMEPHVNFGPQAQGLYALADAWLDIPKYLGFLVERIRERAGVVLEQCEAGELCVDEAGSVDGVRTSSGDLLCKHVVLACGPDTARVLTRLTGYEAFETRFPVQRVPGLLIATPGGHPYQYLRRILYATHKSELHLRPTPDGGLLLGADVTDGMVEEGSSRDQIHDAARHLLELGSELLPALGAPGLIDRCRIGIGVRAVPGDGQSIIGPMPSAEGLTVVVTHSGVTLALLAGELVSDWIQSGRLPDTLTPFALERLQGFA